MRIATFVAFAACAVSALNQVTCDVGVPDCAFPGLEGDTCAPYNDEVPRPSDLTWVLVVASFVGALMAFGIGANDAANSWATAVGSGAVDLKYAVVLGGFFEWVGAVTLGAGVSKTIQKGVSKLTDEECWACGYCDSKMGVMMVGALGALFGGGVFLLLASFTEMPVSTTHSIVGGVVGMNLAGAGSHCIQLGTFAAWPPSGLLGIVLSWILSPLFSGLFAMCFYLLSKQFIFNTVDGSPRYRALVFTPIAYALATFMVVLLMMFKSKGLKKTVPEPWKYGISFIFGFIVLLFSAVVVVPYVKKSLPSELGTSKKILADLVRMESDRRAGKSPTALADVELAQKTATVDDTVKRVTTLGETVAADPEAANEASVKIGLADLQETGTDAHNEDQLDAIYCFKYLLIFNACLESIAHGSNDTANATGPFASIYETWYGGLYECGGAESSWWILGVGGFFVCIGIVTFGYRVMRTIGTKIIVIDYHRAYYIELGSTLATIIATNLEMPVSTTHCQIGAVVAVGLVSVGFQEVDFMILGKIIAAWVFTIPIAGGFAAIVAAIARSVMLN